MDKDKRIKELEHIVAMYEENPASDFYLALLEGIKYVTEKINDKSLNLDEDSFADSIIHLSERADKIFSSIEKGVSVFKQKEDDNPLKKKALSKATGAAI